MKPREMSKEELSDLSNLRYVQNLLRTAKTAIGYVSGNKAVTSSECLNEIKQDIDKAITACQNEIDLYY